MNKELERLKERQAQISARIKAVEAKETAKERKKETRRKILVGSFFLDKYRKADKLEELQQKLDAYLTRKDDRALFDLPNLDEA